MVLPEEDDGELVADALGADEEVLELPNWDEADEELVLDWTVELVLG